MSSMITREQVEDELRQLAGPYKAREVPRVLRMVETWARITLAPQQVVMGHDPYAHLHPGETDEQDRKRRCATCGKVKDLDKGFDYYYSDPYKKRRHCNVCSPASFKIMEYKCPRCKERKELKHFGPEKNKNPRFTYICLLCESRYPSIKDGDKSKNRKSKKRKAA
jgi:phage FluMu protein Com